MKTKKTVFRACPKKAAAWFRRSARIMGTKGNVRLPIVYWNTEGQYVIYVAHRRRLPGNAICLVSRVGGEKQARFWFQVNIGKPRPVTHFEITSGDGKHLTKGSM